MDKKMKLTSDVGECFPIMRRTQNYQFLKH